jgi:hypothetical protein
LWPQWSQTERPPATGLPSGRRVTRTPRKLPMKGAASTGQSHSAASMVTDPLALHCDKRRRMRYCRSRSKNAGL